MSSTNPPRIRRATRADIPAIASMIQELADFEHESAANKATPDRLLATINLADDPPASHAPGFPLSDDTPPASRKVAHCFILTADRTPAESSTSTSTDVYADPTSSSEAGTPATEIAAMALFFYNYSTWLATPGVYLEDLYVRPPHRRRGLATLLFGALAAEARRVSDGRGRLEWACLRWNEGALKFYERIGGVRQEQWIGIRVEGEEKLRRVGGFADEVAKRVGEAR